MQCDEGDKVIGGGCDATVASPFQFYVSRPVGEDKWECSGHGGAKRVWAFCMPHDLPSSLEISRGGNWTSAWCKKGEKIIGGGCFVTSPPFELQYNGPHDDDRWVCGGHGGDKTAWAFCSSRITPSIEVSTSGDWTSVAKARCKNGQKLIGGGCDDTSYPSLQQYNGPGGDDTWVCGGYGGTKTALAICADVEPLAGFFL